MARYDLIKDQYKDSSKLASRANLLVKYGKGDWFNWLGAHCRFAAHQRVLDIGCGAGWFWSAAAPQLPGALQVTLADRSEGMVAEALTRVRGIESGPEVRGLTADVCALPFDDAAFDRVLAFHMLYHADNRHSALAEIIRVLKPDGIALISTNGSVHMRTADALRQQAFQLPDEPVINFTLENAPGLLEPVFGLIEQRTKTDTLRVTDPLDLMAYLTSFPPGDSADDAQLNFLADLVDAAFHAGDGVFEVPVEAGVFICRNQAA